MKKGTDEGLIIIAHVRNNHHFFLSIGYEEVMDEKRVYIIDPNYDLGYSLYETISDVILYQLLSA